MPESIPFTINEYQKQARKTAVYGAPILYPTLGLCGEAGEVAEKVKKAIRDENGYISPERREDLKKELGDVLWYLACISGDLGISLEDVAVANLEKLADRQERGKLQGSGDDR